VAEASADFPALKFKAEVDVGGCAVVFQAVGGHWRGGRFGGFVLEGVVVMQALQPPSCAAGTPVGASVWGSPWQGKQVV
jgi:hypothetical protein